MSNHINAQKCADYLARIGIDVTPELRATWLDRERAHRAERRANRRELQRSCGHFRTYWTTIHHAGGRTEAKACSDCGRYIEYTGASL